MATDILTTAMAPSRSPFPRGLAITDLDLRDDRYPLISSTRRVPPATYQGTPSTNEISSHTQFYPDAVHQAVRAPSLPSSHLLPHDMKNVDTPPLRSTSAQPDILQVSDERRSTLRPDSQSSPLNPGSRSVSYPLDHRQPSNSPPPPSMNEINSQLFRPSQASQASSSEVSKVPPLPDAPLPFQHPRFLQPGVPWQTSPQDSYPAEPYTPSRSFAAGSQLPSPLSAGMRMSSAAQYSPALSIPIPIPVSPNPRVQAQQPTYINPNPVPAPINPISTLQLLPAEEVCAECAMRDQDMADVDVTSPGVWGRESDVQYEDLLRREMEEEAMGVQLQDQHRPRAHGGRLTQANLRLWLSLNPKEPASKGEALDKYVKMQQNLVEAENLAHARAVLESRQLEDRLRDVYSQLRRSAYELGTTSPDVRGVRIRTPHSSMLPLPSQAHGHSREVTMLENGMVVEHLNVRKEERDDRQQRRREEKRARARKSSRGSTYDVSSMLSNMSPLPHTDSSLPLIPLRPSTSRPMSVLTSPTVGMQSNPSIEALSMISAGASPRQTRFLGMQNLSPSFRSSDSLAPSGFSGSMVDMHIALQAGRERLTHSPIESGYQIVDNWRDSSALIPQRRVDAKPEGKPKKRRGLSRLWGLVTGTSKLETGAPPDPSKRRSFDRVHVDDYPLAPPPPLSYLVGRGTGDNGGSALRHVSTPSLPSSVSPNYPLSSASPPTAPSSLLPSPTSSRPIIIPEFSDCRKAPPVLPDSDGEQQPSPVPEEDQASVAQRSVHPTTSEPDLRRRVSQLQNGPVPPVPRVPTLVTHASGEPSVGGWRDKLLPPLPGAPSPIALSQGEMRPRTLYDMREVDGGQALTAPSAQFAYAERRRQSFNGLGNFSSGLVTQTMPARRTGFDPEKYGAFGGSQSALVSVTPRMQQPLPLKRKNKFGFAALLGRKSSLPAQDPEPVEFPLGRSSASDARHEAELGMLYSNGEARQGHPFPRLSMSLTTRKNVESLVDQSPDFVAYRYPSGNQNLPLLQ